MIDIGKVMPGMNMNLLRQIAEEIDKANPGLRESFENSIKENISDEELDEFLEEVEEIFKHEGEP